MIVGLVSRLALKSDDDTLCAIATAIPHRHVMPVGDSGQQMMDRQIARSVAVAVARLST